MGLMSLNLSAVETWWRCGGSIPVRKELPLGHKPFALMLRVDRWGVVANMKSRNYEQV